MAKNKLHFDEMISPLHWTNTLRRFFYSASSLKQQSTDRRVALLGHIILILSQTVSAVTPYCCLLSREAKNTNLIVFRLARPGLEPGYAEFEVSFLTIKRLMP